MGAQVISDFVIESKGHCFFCMGTICPQAQGEDKYELSAVHSLQYLSRFLGIDMKKVFIEKGDIPPNLIAKIEMSTLKAHLCLKCVSINETFSIVCRRLEKIQMEVVSSLEIIYSELLKAEDSNEYRNLSKITDDSGDEWVAKLGILEVVRKEAIQKCSRTIQKGGPRVRVSNISKTDITKIKQKYKLNSRRQVKSDMGCQIKIERDETLTSPFFEDPDVDDEVDFGSERGSPPSPTHWEEEAVVKSEQDKSTSGTMHRHVNKWTSDPRISKNIETIRLTGMPSARKFRCRLCRKTFAKKYYAARHIKSIHLKEKSFQCHQCYKAFTNKHTMKTHMDIHSGLKAYKCPLCLKDFRRKSSMKQHLTIHNR